jgi:hypothetical protein
MSTLQSISQILAQINTTSSSSAWLDDAFTTGYQEKDTTVYNVKTDAFAHIIAAIEAEVPLWEIGTKWADAVRSDPGLDYLKLGPLQDRHKERADMIRRYYRNRLTIQSLKHREMSKFRKDLYDFLTMPETHLRVSFLPMMIRLPSFYLEDVTVDDLARQYKQPVSKVNEVNGVTVEKLEYIVKTHRKTKHQSVNHYWFKNEAGFLHRLSVEESNKLRHVFERLLDAPITIEARFPISNIRGRDISFYSVEGNWKLL